MKKAVIFFYSRSGGTQKVANTLAKKLNLDIEKLNEKSKMGGFGVTWQSIVKSKCEINPISKKLENYHIIILGGPVHMWKPSMVVSQFLSNYQNVLKDKTVFYFQSRGSLVSGCSLPTIVKMINKTYGLKVKEGGDFRWGMEKELWIKNYQEFLKLVKEEMDSGVKEEKENVVEVKEKEKGEEQVDEKKEIV